MSIRCRLLGHIAMDAHHHNQGIDFALCIHCGEDLIRNAGAEEWSPLPQRMRVVWRAAGRDAGAVAARMAPGPMPPRRSTRRTPRIDRRRIAPGPQASSLAGRTALLELCGKFLLAGLADRFLRPSERPGAKAIYLPAPRATPRSRNLSPRASSSARSASPPRLSDRREIW